MRTTTVQSRHSISDTVYQCGATAAQAFWTVFYFFYFLLKGKPEWKCEARLQDDKVQKICCVKAGSNEPTVSQPSYSRPTPSQTYYTAPRSTTAPTYGYQNKGFFGRLGDRFRSAAETFILYAKRVGRFLLSVGSAVIWVLYIILVYLWAFLKMFFTTSVPSKSLPATPKPYQPASTEPSSFNKVEFNPEELAEAYEKEKVPVPAEPEPKFAPVQPQPQIFHHRAEERKTPTRPEIPVAAPRIHPAEHCRQYELDPAASIQAQRSMEVKEGREQGHPIHVPKFEQPAPAPTPAPAPAPAPIQQQSYVEPREQVPPIQVQDFAATREPPPPTQTPRFTDTRDHGSYIQQPDQASYIQQPSFPDTRDQAPLIQPQKFTEYREPPAPFQPASFQDTRDQAPLFQPQKFTDTSLDGRDSVRDMREDQWESGSQAASARAGVGTREMTPRTNSPTKREPPTIGKLPANVMAELHGTQRMRQEREASIQREMTQSCHPDMASWKAENNDRYDRSASATPFRASSVGPTMRRLEQVVSRLEDSPDNEAQYVFRPKPTEYMMGRPVYTPIEEAEQMRDIINSRERSVSVPQNPFLNYARPFYGSRPVTPAHSVSGRYTPFGQESYATYPYRSEEDGVRRRARTVGPIGRDTMPRVTHSFYANSPLASHTTRRTPIPFDRGANFAYDRDGVTQGKVTNQVRRWPPTSNATGADVNKDEFVREVGREPDDGLVTTMARRVFERKTEDNFKWHDDRGRLLDEKSEKSWKGELDTVLRDGPDQARQWSRRMEVLPTGDTRFQDVRRQYNNNFVVESIVRNY